VVNPRATSRASKTTPQTVSTKPSPLTTPFETGLGEFLYREGI